MELVMIGQRIEPITLSQFEDGTIQVDDGHHRLAAYWLVGRRELYPYEYELLYRDNYKPRFGKVKDLVKRNEPFRNPHWSW